MGSDDLKGFSVFTDTQSNFLSATLVGTFNNLSVDPHVGTIFDLTDTTARYVRLQVTSNYGSQTTTIGEVAFDVSSATAPVPEPSTLAIFGLGIAGMAGCRRRRRK